MAKVPFSKLQTTVSNSVITLSYPNKAGEEICFEVKHYLPYKEKMELVQNVINQSIDDNGYYNPMRVQLYTTLEVIYYYTSLTFTEKQKEDPFKLYDLLVSTGIFDRVVEYIGEEWYSLQSHIETVIENIYAYNNSAAGILHSISNDYSNTTINIEALQNQLKDPESFEMLR
jgi:hypothetical protein